MTDEKRFFLFESIAGDVQLDDYRVMDQTIDRGSGRHRILENLLCPVTLRLWPLFVV